MDIRQVAEQLIVQLWAESDKLRERAEGVRLFLQTIISEAEKEDEQRRQQSENAGTPAAEEKQTK